VIRIESNAFSRTLVVLGIAAALAACQQERNTNAPVSSARDVPPATAAAATTPEPARVPPGDPSLPPHDTQAAPSGSDGAHTALTKDERDKALPLEGQVNNYSSDAFAKRGDESIPRGSPDAPRGNEAVATPNSYPKEPK
jgi:hypothetical protein